MDYVMIEFNDMSLFTGEIIWLWRNNERYQLKSKPCIYVELNILKYRGKTNALNMLRTSCYSMHTAYMTLWKEAVRYNWLFPEDGKINYIGEAISTIKTNSKFVLLKTKDYHVFPVPRLSWPHSSAWRHIPLPWLQLPQFVARIVSGVGFGGEYEPLHPKRCQHQQGMVSRTVSRSTKFIFKNGLWPIRK